MSKGLSQAFPLYKALGADRQCLLLPAEQLSVLRRVYRAEEHLRVLVGAGDTHRSTALHRQPWVVIEGCRSGMLCTSAARASRRQGSVDAQILKHSDATLVCAGGQGGHRLAPLKRLGLERVESPGCKPVASTNADRACFVFTASTQFGYLLAR